MFSCTMYFNCNVPLHFNHEDAGSIFIWYVNIQLPEYTAQARRPQEKSSASWKSNISHSINVVPLNSVQNSHLQKNINNKSFVHFIIYVFIHYTEWQKFLTWMVVMHSPEWICTEFIHECNADLFTVTPKYLQRVCYLLERVCSQTQLCQIKMF